jgi:hypothetical protein
MFAKATNLGFAQRVVATLVASAVLLWSIGMYHTAQAANLVSVSDTLSDSDLSVTSAHTIAFTIPTGSSLAAAASFTITFPTDLGSGFTGVNTVLSGDLTVTVNNVGVAVDSFSAVGQVLTISLDTVANADEEVVVAIADGKITNPDAAGSTEIVVQTPADIGKTRVAIIDNVLVTAIVQTTFDFTISGLATSTAVNGTSTTGSTTATAIPFGVLEAGEIKSLGQRLNVETNARNGFVVTVNSDGNLQSANGAIIDNFVDGSDVAVPGTSWIAPSNDVNDETTWGHWGLTSNDTDLAVPFGANEFIGASTTPRQVFSHDGPSDGSTQDIGVAEVLYQIEITTLQEAADDYSTILTYVATPTF